MREMIPHGIPPHSASDAGKVLTAKENGGEEWKYPQGGEIPAATADTLGGVKVAQTNSVKADTNGRLTVNTPALDASHITSLVVTSILKNDLTVKALIDDGSMTDQQLQSEFDSLNYDVLDGYGDVTVMFVPARSGSWSYQRDYDDYVQTNISSGDLYLLKYDADAGHVVMPYIYGENLRLLLVNGL